MVDLDATVTGLGRRAVPLLQRAVDAGVTLNRPAASATSASCAPFGRRRRRPRQPDRQRSRRRVGVRRRPSGGGAETRRGNAGHTVGRSLRGRRAHLAGTTHPVPSPLQRMVGPLVDLGCLRTTTDLTRMLTPLARVVPVVSSDESVPVPTRPPVLGLTVTWQKLDGRRELGWSWRRCGGPCPAHPADGWAGEDRRPPAGDRRVPEALLRAERLLGSDALAPRRPRPARPARDRGPRGSPREQGPTSARPTRSRRSRSTSWRATRRAGRGAVGTDPAPTGSTSSDHHRRGRATPAGRRAGRPHAGEFPRAERAVPHRPTPDRLRGGPRAELREPGDGDRLSVRHDLGDVGTAGRPRRRRRPGRRVGPPRRPCATSSTSPPRTHRPGQRPAALPTRRVPLAGVLGRSTASAGSSPTTWASGRPRSGPGVPRGVDRRGPAVRSSRRPVS